MDMLKSNQGKAKILVVDDELLVAADIKRIIEKAGHKLVGSAINAEEAIGYVKLEKPDLVLMDIKLKHDIDGISIAEKIQSIADTPIIFLTAFSDQDTFERAKKLGPFGYLIKPFNSRELTIAIENTLYKYSLEKHLRENEKKFRLFYENSPLPYHSLDMAGKILEINSAWLDELGYSKEEVIGHHLSEFLTLPSAAKLPAALHEYILAGEIKGMEYEYKHKNGSIILMSVSGKISKEENRETLRTHCVLHNITERKRSEELLKEAKEKFESIYKLSPYAITITDLKTGIAVDVNEAFEELTGYSRAEVIGKRSTELNLWDNPTQREIFASDVVEKKPYLNNEIYVRKKTGEKIECLVSAKVIELSGKSCILSIVKDISERKFSENALRESENKMQSIFRAAPIGIGVVLNRTIMQVNEEYCRMTGYDYAELIGMDSKMIYPTEEDYKYVGTEKYRQIEEKGYGRVETRWRKKDGTVIDIFLSSTPIDPERPEKGIVFTAIDITERKKMENTLRKSEAKSRELLDNLVSGVMIVDTDGIWNYLNKKAAENLGGEPKDFVGKNIFDFLPKNINQLSFIKDNDTLNPSETVMYEAAFDMPGSSEKHYLVSDQILKDDEGNPYGVLSNSIDITSRKLAEKALKISEEKYRYLFNVNHDAIFVYPFQNNMVSNFIEINDTASQLVGYSKEELFNMTILDLDVKLNRKDVEKRMMDYRTKGKTIFESIIKTKQGNLIEVEISAYILQYQGRPVIMALVRNISDKKKAELEIKEREAKFSAFMDNLMGVAYIKDADLRYVYLNKRIQELFNINLDDWIGKKDADLKFFPESVLGEILTHDRQVIDKNQILETIEHIPINKELHYWKTIKFPLPIGDSKQHLLAGVGIDITSEKRLEMAMNNIIALNHELDELTIDDILIKCMESCEAATNSKISFFHFLNPDQKTITNRTWSSNTLKDCNVQNLAAHYPIGEAGVWIECVDRRGPVVHNDYNSLPNKKGLPEGHVPIIRQLTIPIFEEDKIAAIVGVGNKETNYEELDIKIVELISNNVWKIIRRKKAEEDLKNSLTEKETLLRELYHRTKNNMQVISSMLLLQTFDSGDSQLNRILVETSNRIRAMALVHEKLYQSKNLSKVNLKDYIDDLVKLLVSIYNSNGENVLISKEIEDTFVLIDYAVPCGLVINEIVSNTFKHRFPENRDGELSIKMFRNEDEEIVFISQDNCICDSMDMGLESQNPFGIELIKTIVEHQLGGQIEFRNNNGFYIKISFKDNQYKSRV